MESRGRKSTASLSVLSFVPGQRLEPPPELPEAMAIRWREITATKPADWFGPDTACLLEAYVRGEGILKTVAAQLDVFEPEWLTSDAGMARYQKLTTIQQKQSQVQNSLGTKMRITQQSRYDAKTAATAAKAASPASRKPWERSAG